MFLGYVLGGKRLGGNFPVDKCPGGGGGAGNVLESQ